MKLLHKLTSLGIRNENSLLAFASVRAISEIEAPESSEFLKKAILKAPKKIAEDLVSALQGSDEFNVPILFESLKHKNSEVVVVAVKGLSGKTDSADFIYASSPVSRVTKALIRLLKHPDRAVRNEVLNGFHLYGFRGRTPFKEIEPFLYPPKSEDLPESLKRDLIYEFKRPAEKATTDSPAVRALARLTKSPDPVVAQEAVIKLRGIHAPLVVPTLIAATQYPKPDVAKVAIEGLGDYIATPEITRALIGNVEHPNINVVGAAVEQLLKINAPGVQKAIFKAIRHKNPNVAEYAVRTVITRNKNGRYLLPSLIAASESKNKDVVEVAVEGLARYHGSAGKAAYKRAIQNFNALLRIENACLARELASQKKK